MRKLKLLFLVLAGMLANNFSAFAQSVVSDAYARITPHSNSSLFDGVFTVEVSDTTSTSAIEVKLGTADGLSDLVSYTFAYDVTTGLPSGASYSRAGKTCTLDVGTIALSDSYYGEVRIQSNGNWSSAYKFIGN